MSERPNSWHRDSLPWWGWVAMTLMRVWALAAAVLPLAAFLGAGWLWLHWRDPAVVRVVRAVTHQLAEWIAALEHAAH